MHEYSPVILLFLGILAGIWLNRRDFADLKADMNRRMADLKADMNRQFSEVRGRLDAIEKDLRQYSKLEGRVEELSRR